MAMKLMSPSETKEESGKDISRDLLRSQELKKLLNDLNIRVAKAQADFSSMLVGQTARWEREEGECTAKKRGLEKEITALEERKREVLVPIDNLKVEVEQKMNEADQLLSEAKNREQEAAETVERFENKLDELGQRETDVIRKEKETVLREHGVNVQRDSIAEQSKMLTQQMHEFSGKKQFDESELEKKKEELILLEQSLVSRASSLVQKEGELKFMAGGIKEATDKLEKLRKEELVPVEELKANANKLFEEATHSLSSAENERTEAIKIHKQAQTDYDEKLASLGDRESKVLREENKVVESKQTFKDERDALNIRQEELRVKFSDYDNNNAQLKNERKDFLREKEVQNKLLDKLTNNANKKESDALALVEKADKIKQELLAFQRNTEGREKTLNAKEKDLKKEEIRLDVIYKQLTEDNRKSNEGKAELTRERESFAIWKDEAEKAVEDKMMDVSRRHTVLAKKEDKNKRQEKFLAEWGVRLKEERQLLDANWKELDRKKHG